VDVAPDGEQVLSRLRVHDYEVVLLDLMLPGIGGLEVLRRMRARGDDAHVLPLSAKDRAEDRVEGLRLGADDYLTKPFAFEELEARLQSLVRRRSEQKAPKLEVGGLVVDTVRRRVEREGEPVRLTPSEHALLEFLLRHRGQTFTQSRILDHLRSSDADVSSNVVEVLVSSPRRKIQRAEDEPVVRTRRGFGYVIE
jgi:DNA-binding response OmpR family regulator